MSGSGTLVTGGLAGLAAAGLTTAAAAGLVRRERIYLPRVYAERVDTRRDPLGVALRYGCAGLTVGVRVDDAGRLRLAGCDDPGRTLRALVLDPLSARVERTGRVYGAQHEPFTLVLEAERDAERARVLDALDDDLARYPQVLTGCVDGRVRSGAVLVVMVGAPLCTLDGSIGADRLYFGEGTLADVGRGIPTRSLPIVGEHVAWRLGWDGRGAMLAEERHFLRALVRAAHAEGKRVRFYGVPESRRVVRQAFWRELRSAGADLIGARNLGMLRRYLRHHHAHRWTL
jgi:hypothetical protein